MITHNHPSPMLYTTWLVPLTSPPVTTRLPTRSHPAASWSNDIAGPSPYARALLPRLRPQVLRVCVNTVHFSARFALPHLPWQSPYVNALRVPYQWTSHNLTPFALGVSFMLFSTKTRLYNGDMTFTIRSDPRHQYNNTNLSTPRIPAASRVTHAT